MDDAQQTRDDARYAALGARDPRFDGLFFVGVGSTGIYCRPICPAKTPARLQCTFFELAVDAEQAGFRACLRCRPERAPGAATNGAISETASTDAVQTLAALALRKIHAGALNEGGVDDLAAELGVSARHVRRAVEARFGVTLVELAQSRRVALAKQLLQDTSLPLADVAFAAGFQSVRRFNVAFKARMGQAPSAIRRGAATRGAGLTLRLEARPPFDWTRLVAFLGARAIPGVERVDDGAYHRVVHVGGRVGTLTVRNDPGRSGVVLAVSQALLPALMGIVARVRRLFDLDAQPEHVAAHFASDALLGPLVSARPGLRVPGAFDPFEAGVRALLGQQVSVKAATTLAGRFAAAFGTALTEAVATEASGDAPHGLTHRFPTAAEIQAVRPDAIAQIGLPLARAVGIHALADAVAAGRVRFDGMAPLDAFVDSLTTLPGIGPWTAHYLALRGVHHPDAFPAADLGVQKALGERSGKATVARAEAWRPWRAYAVLHLWHSFEPATETP